MWPQGAGIFASTNRPESAKLFMSWMMSDAVQSALVGETGTFPLMVTNSTNTTVWADQSVAPSHFGKFMADRETVEWWRFQFESFLGPPQGASPLTYGI